MSASTNDDDDAEVVEMIACEDCGHMVPERNMAIHRVRACRGRARPTSNDDDDDDDNSNNGHANSPNHNKNNSNNDTVNVDVDVIDLSESTSNSSPSAAAKTSEAASRKRQDDERSSPQPRRRRRRHRGRLKRDEDDDDENDKIHDSADSSNEDENMDLEDDQQNQEVVELLDDDDDDDEWACPRCTLLNDQSAARCDACGHDNPTITTASASAFGGNNHAYSDGVRPADPVRRERLIGGDDSFEGDGGGVGGSPLGLVGGSALMGAVIGAGGAYLRGREVGRGALEGSVAGAVSGMFMNELMRTPTRPSRAARTATSTSRASHSMNANHHENNNDSLSQARSASANGQPPYPVMGGGSNRRFTRRPRPSFRVATIPSPDGYTTTVVSSSGRDGSTRVVRRSHHAERDPLFSLMMHTLLAERGAGRFGGDPEGIDRMSYEQLLSAFGDGTENMGASDGAIFSLPTSIVKTKDDGTVDLPTDACQCSVCLEDFEAGQERTILPCLHGFHSGCVNKWLKTNGACPVCKHRITS